MKKSFKRGFGLTLGYFAARCVIFAIEKIVVAVCDTKNRSNDKEEKESTSESQD